MADIELVIKIPDDVYEQAINGTEYDTLSLGIKLRQSVQEGIVIPKGHGKLMIVLKDFDMPTGCQKCKFFRKHMFGNGLDYSYSCVLGAKEFPMPWIRQLDNRAVDCPIIETDR